MKSPRFKNKESRLHFHAKEDLSNWLKSNPKLLGLSQIVKICIERKLAVMGFIIFTPDIIIYDENGIRFYIEVCKSNPVSNIKLENITIYNKEHRWCGIELIEISAKWIMDQCNIPDRLQIMRRIRIS